MIRKYCADVPDTRYSEHVHVPTPPTYDCSAIQLFFGGDSDIEAMVRRFKSASATAMESKISIADNAMHKEKRAPGAIGRILSGIKESELSPLPGDVIASPCGATDPWLFTTRKNALRWGASAFPLPGVGCVMQNGKSKLCIALLNVSSLLGGGIVLQNCQKFLESDAGAKFAEQECAWVALDEHETLTILWGWVAIPVYCDTSKTAPEWAHAWVLPVFSAKATRATCANSIQAIKQFNDEFFKTMSSNARWKRRADFCHTWFESLAQSESNAGTA